MKIILPLAKSEITGLQFHSYFLAAILNNKENYNFLYNNYIQLIVRYKKYSHVDFMFESLLSTCDHLPIQKLNIKGEIIDINDFIFKTIKNGFYIVINLNECFLPHRKAYNSYYFRHDILIYGIDTCEQICYTCGYDEFGHYKETEYKLSDIEKAYYKLESDWEFEHCIYKLKSLEKNDLDIFKINNDLIDYISCKNSYTKAIDSFLYNGSVNEHIINISSINCYGLNIYNFLIQEINNHITNNSSIDLRSYHLLYEHKCIIYNLIKTLAKEGYINYSIERYKDIVDSSKRLKLMLIKYLLTSDFKIRERILYLLPRILETEKRELIEVQKELENYIKNKSN